MFRDTALPQCAGRFESHSFHNISVSWPAQGLGWELGRDITTCLLCLFISRSVVFLFFHRRELDIVATVVVISCAFSKCMLFKENNLSMSHQNKFVLVLFLTAVCFRGPFFFFWFFCFFCRIPVC